MPLRAPIQHYAFIYRVKNLQNCNTAVGLARSAIISIHRKMEMATKRDNNMTTSNEMKSKGKTHPHPAALLSHKAPAFRAGRARREPKRKQDTSHRKIFSNSQQPQNKQIRHVSSSSSSSSSSFFSFFSVLSAFVSFFLFFVRLLFGIYGRPY